MLLWVTDKTHLPKTLTDSPSCTAPGFTSQGKWKTAAAGSIVTRKKQKLTGQTNGTQFETVKCWWLPFLHPWLREVDYFRGSRHMTGCLVALSGASQENMSSRAILCLWLASVRCLVKSVIKWLVRWLRLETKSKSKPIRGSVGAGLRGILLRGKK